MRKMILLHGIVTVLFVGMAVAPGLTDDEAKNRAALQEILRLDKGGILRGTHFNMTKEMVSYLETGNREFINERGHLGYQLKENPASVNRAVEIYYDFDGRGLYYVTARAKQKDRAAADKLFHSLKEHFTQNYGDRQITKNGYSLWSAKDKMKGFQYQIAFKQFDDSILIEFYVI